MATITTTVPITTSPSISISFTYPPPPSHPVAQVKTLGMGSVVPSSFKSRSPPSCRAKLGANPAIRSGRQQVQHHQTNHQQTNDDSAKLSIVIVLCQFWHDLSARLFNFSSSVSLWQRVRVGSTSPLQLNSSTSLRSQGRSPIVIPTAFSLCSFLSFCLSVDLASQNSQLLTPQRSHLPLFSFFQYARYVAGHVVSHILLRSSRPQLGSRWIKVWPLLSLLYIYLHSTSVEDKF